MPPKKATTISKSRSLPKSSKKISKAGSKRRRASPQSDFAEVFSTLRDVMASYAGELQATANGPKKYYLVTKSLSWKGGPMFFGAVIMGKAYVSYHLMPLYVQPALMKQISPELKRHMQGKSCFNFHSPDKNLFTELSVLTKSGLELYRSKALL